MPHLMGPLRRYYDLHDVCKTIKCQPPKQEVIKSALINAGYR
jgi:tRNA G26 N,N-dimethylase Trm1